MLRRVLLVIATAYLGAALVARATESLGAIRCDCRHTCWCKKPGLSLLRWVMPVGHDAR